MLDSESSTLAVSTELCGPGTARSTATDEEFYDDDEKYTKCRKCDWKKGEWQDLHGKPNCKQVDDGRVVGQCVLEGC